MEACITQYYSLRPQEFPLIQKLRLSISGGIDIESRSAEVAITFRSRKPEVKRKLKLVCYDVKDIDFRLASLPDLSVFLDIHGLEPVNGQMQSGFVVVAEQFYDAFKFTCSAFEARLLEEDEQ